LESQQPQQQQRPSAGYSAAVVAVQCEFGARGHLGELSGSVDGQRKPHPRASRDESAAAAANGRQKSLKSPALKGPITLVIEWASVSLHWRVLLARYLDLTN
jgi:hypothetical protein